MSDATRDVILHALRVDVPVDDFFDEIQEFLEQHGADEHAATLMALRELRADHQVRSKAAAAAAAWIERHAGTVPDEDAPIDGVYPPRPIEDELEAVAEVLRRLSHKMIFNTTAVLCAVAGRPR